MSVLAMVVSRTPSATVSSNARFVYGTRPVSMPVTIMTRVLFSVFLFVLAAPASAYIGPGAGISVLGSLVGIVAAVFIALFAIVAWPVRRMLKKRKQRNEVTAENPQQDVPSEPAE